MNESEKHFVVVLRGESAARFRPESGPVQLLKVGSPVGPIDLVFDTRYSDEGLEDPIPREMIVEAHVVAACTLEQAIDAALGAGNMLVPWFALSTNAPIGDLDVHLSFDATQGLTEHEFFENFLPDERGRPRHGRDVPRAETIAVLDAVGAHSGFERLHRAASQYREALRYWRHGKETYVVMHLWMAVEALTKVAFARALQQEGCETDEELGQLWEISSDRTDCERCATRSFKSKLTGEVRRRYIFHGDSACNRDTRRASDGFEHSYMGFSDVYKLASSIRDRAAQHVRQAILELCDAPDEVIGKLLSPPFDTVRASWPFTMYVRGDFIGDADNLAAPDERYPLLHWEHRLKSFRRNPDGTTTIQPEDNVTVKAADGVQFRPKSREIWGPENDPVPEAGSTQEGDSP